MNVNGGRRKKSKRQGNRPNNKKFAAETVINIRQDELAEEQQCYETDLGFDLGQIALMKDSAFFRAAVHLLVRIVTAIVIVSVTIIVSALRDEQRAVVYVLLVTTVIIIVTYVCDVPGWNNSDTPTAELVLLWNWWAIVNFIFKLCVKLAFAETLMSNVIGSITVLILLIMIVMPNNRLRAIPVTAFLCLFLLPTADVGLFDESAVVATFRVLLMFTLFLILDLWLPIRTKGKDYTETKTINHRSLFILIYSTWVLLVRPWWWILFLFVLAYAYLKRSRRIHPTHTPAAEVHKRSSSDVEEGYQSDMSSQSINDEDMLSSDDDNTSQSLDGVEVEDYDDDWTDEEDFDLTSKTNVHKVDEDDLISQQPAAHPTSEKLTPKQQKKRAASKKPKAKKRPKLFI